MELNQLKVIIPETSANLVGSEIILSLETGTHSVCVPFRSKNSNGEFIFPYFVITPHMLYLPREDCKEDLGQIIPLRGITLNLLNSIRELNWLIKEKVDEADIWLIPKSLHNSIFRNSPYWFYGSITPANRLFCI
ncbi:hypothetical protein AGMMS49975_14320 [Clostridia bacterium]|nr:hypothetical protein AGMMS49975_14320 [Clostridia bacterium]